MKIIRRSDHVEHVSYLLEFERVDGRGGFAFDCDAAGNVLSLTPAGADSLAFCLRGEGVTASGVREFRRWHHQCAIGRCDCGREVWLSAFTNTCDCGADYNMGGQRLADRSQWGEETGETASEILSGGMDE